MDEELLKAMGIAENKEEYKKTSADKTQTNAKSYVGVNVISFLIPLLGFMGYITHINSDYTLAKKCLSSAIWGMIIGAIALLIIFNM